MSVVPETTSINLGVQHKRHRAIIMGSRYVIFFFYEGALFQRVVFINATYKRDHS